MAKQMDDMMAEIQGISESLDAMEGRLNKRFEEVQREIANQGNLTREEIAALGEEMSAQAARQALQLAASFNEVTCNSNRNARMVLGEILASEKRINEKLDSMEATILAGQAAQGKSLKETIDSGLADLQAETEKGFSRIASSITSLSDKVTEMQGSIDQLNAKADQIITALNDVDTKLQGGR